MKTYQISEELRNQLIAVLGDYKEDAEDLDAMGGIPKCWIDDITILISELENLKDGNLEKLFDCGFLKALLYIKQIMQSHFIVENKVIELLDFMIEHQSELTDKELYVSLKDGSFVLKGKEDENI